MVNGHWSSSPIFEVPLASLMLFLLNIDLLRFEEKNRSEMYVVSLNYEGCISAVRFLVQEIALTMRG